MATILYAKDWGGPLLARGELGDWFEAEKHCLFGRKVYVGGWGKGLHRDYEGGSAFLLCLPSCPPTSSLDHNSPRFPLLASESRCPCIHKCSNKNIRSPMPAAVVSILADVSTSRQSTPNLWRWDQVF